MDQQLQHNPDTVKKEAPYQKSHFQLPETFRDLTKVYISLANKIVGYNFFKPYDSY